MSPLLRIVHIFIEIEAASEMAVKAAADKLGFDWNDAAFGDIMTAYRAEYPKTGVAP
jgi:hypothetical protein